MRANQDGACRSLYICNAFEDSVRIERGITTDSPAASRKVLGLCRAVRIAGGKAYVISLGRGRVTGSGARHLRRVRRTNGVPILYLDFWDVPVVTHVISMVSLCVVLLRLRRRASSVVWYNYAAHYVLALMLARAFGLRCVLDLEDGHRTDDHSFRNRLDGWLLKLHAALCTGGAMLASRQLADQVNVQKTYVCYGVVESGRADKEWATDGRLQVLLGGSLMKATGADLFLDALSLLLRDSAQALTRLRFVVTGYGECAARLEHAALTELKDSLTFRGRVTDREYAEIVRTSHVGLCLKLPSTLMGLTTFPSKVIELAARGLLVVSTRVSDVPLVFDAASAVFLEQPTAEALAQLFRAIVRDPPSAHKIALAGQARVRSLLSEQRVGGELWRFWNGETPRRRRHARSVSGITNA